MNFFIEFNMENAAFEDGNAGEEVARILKKIADKVKNDSFSDDGDVNKIYDVNGNHIGSYGYNTTPAYQATRDNGGYSA